MYSTVLKKKMKPQLCFFLQKPSLVMTHFELKALSGYKGQLPSIYRRYVDDTFLIFDKQTNMELFFKYMNHQHNNIKFTKEIESDSTLPFLDVLITRNDDGHLPHLCIGNLNSQACT